MLPIYFLSPKFRILTIAKIICHSGFDPASSPYPVLGNFSPILQVNPPPNSLYHATLYTCTQKPVRKMHQRQILKPSYLTKRTQIMFRQVLPAAGWCHLTVQMSMKCKLWNNRK